MYRPAPRPSHSQVTASTVPSVTPASDGGLITVSNRTSDAFSLLAIDFQGVYQVNVAATTERLAMLRLSLSLLAAPFGATVALVGARVVAPSSLTAWTHVPRYLFGLLAAFGLLAVLPYLRMIEASITHARTARAMNNFRLLYTLELRAEFAGIGWSPNLPVDPRFPAVFAPLSFSGVTAVALAVLDAACLAVGLAGLAGLRPAPGILGAAVAAATTALLGLCYLRTGPARPRRRPANPFDFPSVET